MITEKQLKVFEVFAKKPFAEYMRKQIKKESRERSNNTLALFINKLKKEEVLIERKVGKSGLLTLNLNNGQTYHYISLCNERRINHVVKMSLRILKEEISDATIFYSITIFGSYAAGEQKPSSDVDIAVFIEDDRKRKDIIAAINSAKLKATADIDIHVITKAEMLEMLTNDEENLGKQIARKHIAVHNHQIFYEIIREGIKHGFKL